jgi:methylated-DNA-[protein]-cysteine S-methyltransferase
METPTDDAGIYARESDYLERYVQFGEAGDRVISLSFPTHPEDVTSDEHALLDRIDDYLTGTEDDFADVTVGLTVPTDHRQVLEAVREIPYGENATVEQVTRMTPDLDSSDQEDQTTVREALAANPVPLLIPDHRVRDGPSAAPPPVEQKLRSLEGL